MSMPYICILIYALWVMHMLKAPFAAIDPKPTHACSCIGP